jgi:tellurite resistance protein TehA-like permease
MNDTRYIFTNLNTMGWVLIVLGAIQLTGGFSLIAGNTYGRVIGIIGGSLGAIGALFSIGGANPWWSLPSSSCVSGSSTASSSSETTNARRQPKSA